MATLDFGSWTDGNEAILAKVDRVRPWVSTIFRKDHDGSEANALVAMCFGATIEEAVALSRLIGAAPELLAAAEMLASLQSEDNGRSFPTAEQCAFAKRASAKAKGHA